MFALAESGIVVGFKSKPPVIAIWVGLTARVRALELLGPFRKHAVKFGLGDVRHRTGVDSGHLHFAKLRQRKLANIVLSRLVL